MTKRRLREAAHQDCLEMSGIFAAAAVRRSSFWGHGVAEAQAVSGLG
jgi:hypothetical protein